jgi:putative ATPase
MSDDSSPEQINLFSLSQFEDSEIKHVESETSLKSWQDYRGQKQVVDYLKRYSATTLPHLILWGPPGSGKTTLAKLLAHEFKLPLFTLNAVLTGVSDLKSTIQKLLEKRGHALLFIDEIHRYNKAQQDALLPYLEKRLFLFIGATTEYPQTALNKALLSRIKTLELKALEEHDILAILDEKCTTAQRSLTLEIKQLIAQWCLGDARKAQLFMDDLFSLSLGEQNQKEKVLELMNTHRDYDKSQTRHYDVISAFIKSIRGSDPDASLLWLAVMIDGGEDPVFIARRLAILASEDIGLANSQALLVAQSTLAIVQQIGLPEARITLAHATLFLALSPKSNSAYLAIDEALTYVKNHPTLAVPEPLKNQGVRKAEYLYPHNYPEHWVKQNYWPEKTQREIFWNSREQGSEKMLKEGHAKRKD